jgi:carbamoyl-phosphate synthase large subunit
MYSVGYRMPVKAVLISSGPAKAKADLLEAVRLLEKLGYKIFATRGTQQFLSNAGIAAKVAYWPDEAGIAKYSGADKSGWLTW